MSERDLDEIAGRMRETLRSLFLASREVRRRAGGTGNGRCSPPRPPEGPAGPGEREEALGERQRNIRRQREEAWALVALIEETRRRLAVRRRRIERRERQIADGQRELDVKRQALDRREEEIEEALEQARTELDRTRRQLEEARRDRHEVAAGSGDEGRGFDPPPPPTPQPRAAPRGGARLIMYAAHDSHREVMLTEPVTVFGREKHCGVHLPLQSVSREHCRIERRSEALWLVDLGSRNGTLHNGRPVDEEARLSDGDTINVGGVRFRVDF